MSKIQIIIVYACPEHQYYCQFILRKESTIEQAIYISGILNKIHDIDLKKNKVGIFNKLCTLKTIIYDGDRIEIYRNLIADPKELRRYRSKCILKNDM